MFTLNQIKEAHSKVKSGADFPKYIQDLKIGGIVKYITYVIDGHVEYRGKDNQSLISNEMYSIMEIASTTKKNEFKNHLKAHQEGKTNYMTFCEDCAKTGIKRWVVDILSKTCTYYDKSEKLVLTEKIPI